MEKIFFDSQEQIRESINTGDKKHDLEVINAILSGNAEIKQEEAQPEQIDNNTSMPSVEEQPETTEIKSIDTMVMEEEINNQNKYIDLVEQKA